MGNINKAALDRHITGNFGEKQFESLRDECRYIIDGLNELKQKNKITKKEEEVLSQAVNWLEETLADL